MVRLELLWSEQSAIHRQPKNVSQAYILTGRLGGGSKKVIFCSSRIGAGTDAVATSPTRRDRQQGKRTINFMML